MPHDDIVKELEELIREYEQAHCNDVPLDFEQEEPRKRRGPRSKARQPKSERYAPLNNRQVWEDAGFDVEDH